MRIILLVRQGSKRQGQGERMSLDMKSITDMFRIYNSSFLSSKLVTRLHVLEWMRGSTVYGIIWRAPFQHLEDRQRKVKHSLEKLPFKGTIHAPLNINFLKFSLQFLILHTRANYTYIWSISVNWISPSSKIKFSCLYYQQHLLRR